MKFNYNKITKIFYIILEIFLEIFNFQKFSKKKKELKI